MRILYLHQHFNTPQGAGGTRSYEMARRLVGAGHSVVMVCGSYRGSDTGLTGSFIRGMRRGHVDGIDVCEFQLSYANSDSFLTRTVTFLRYVVRTAGLVLREPYDLAFATTTPLTVGLPGMLAKWGRRKRFVFEVRDLWPELPRAMGVITNPVILGAMGVLEWMSYRSADRLIALAPGIAKGIVRRGVPADRICLVPNGCDLDVFGGDVVPARPTDIPATDLLAVYTGTHGLANGLDALIDAAVVLQRRGRRDIHLLLVGEGGRKAHLQRRAVEESLTQVHFVAPMGKRQLASLIAGADVGVQSLANVPAFYEGTSPNKFFDYLAAGRPVITNYPGWIAGLIEQHACGFVAPPENPEALADAFEAAAADRTRLRAMGGHARTLAEAEFNRDQLADRFVTWLEGAAR